MTDPISIDSRRTLPAGRSGPVQSWRARILTWIYPNRGWAGVQTKIRPMPGKPARFAAGGAK